MASQWGASLVLVSACGASTQTGTGGSGGATTTTTSGSTSSTDPGLDGGVAVGNLSPPPEPTCAGPVYDAGFGYHGQCCEIVLCAAAVGGECPQAADAAGYLQGIPPGSGSCTCSELPLRGPYGGDSAEPCCYLVGSIGCDGRPLVVDGRARLADVVTAPSTWSRAERAGDEGRAFAEALAALDVGGLPADARARLAERWSRRARFEHASIASFSRFSLALAAFGAPPALLEATHHAALDEIEHARLALSIASAYAGRSLGFGPLRVDGAFADLTSLEAATVAAVAEACVGETMAAVEAGETARRSGPAAVRAALSTIADDEARHAELGWAFVRWALGVGDPRLRERVAAAFEAAIDDVARATPGEDSLPGHGFLPGAEVVELRRRVIAEVIRPAAEALLRGALAQPTTAPASLC